MSDSMTPPPQPSAGQASSADPLVGTTLLNRVKIVAPIGRGGMGTVYLGEQTRLDRRCAVKVLDPALAARAGGEFGRRFLLEASVVAKLAHPHVVTVFEYGETPTGTCFIAMEYLEGRTIADELREGPMAPGRAVHIAGQACRALQAAHARGVVHGDVKPANLFLVHRDDDADFVKVLDFGLVREVRGPDGGDVPPSDTFLGSPRYVSPEQVQGKEIDARSDVYSLGVALYAMLAGRPPFDRRTELATMMAQVSDAPPPFSEAAPRVALPPGLEGVVMKCLAKDPEQRWASVAELGAALRSVEGIESFDDFAPSSPRRGAIRDTIPSARLRTRRRSLFVGLAGGAALGVALLFVIVQRRTSAPDPVTTHASVTVSPVAAPVMAPERTAVVHVVTDPPGAKVKEEGETLCETTPCDVLYRGAAADPSTEHLLALLLPGYKLERAIATAASPVVVKLTRSR
jgi:eukaryotic-like serine/threonine-protein kinase